MITWHPTADFVNLKLRADFLKKTREFFASRRVLEVETPTLSAAAVNDPYMKVFSTIYSGPGKHYSKVLYLQTSPEFHMKRLLAAGSGCIYQVTRAFRDGEAGRYHNPEFTILEWYRVGFDYHQLMDEVTELVMQLVGDRIELSGVEHLSYAELFNCHFNINPHRTSVAELASCAMEWNLSIPETMDTNDPDPWLSLLLTHCIEPQLGLGKLTFIYDYPASQAALARIRPDNPPISERFELYINGIELANGFQELCDANEQRLRFDAENIKRQSVGMPITPVDGRLLAALESGMPECAGVALGFDRLLMLATGADSLVSVLTFPLDYA